MPGGTASVTATFEEKGVQVVTIVLDEIFIYPNTPHITEKQTYSTSNYYEKLGDGLVTIEYKPKGADDSEYTTEVPTKYGEYTLRVSVAEGSDYKSGFATKDFIYSPQIITPSEGLSAGAIAGICVGCLFSLLLVSYLIGYFFLYRKGKLDEKKIKVIYKFLPRGEKNLKEDN